MLFEGLLDVDSFTTETTEIPEELVMRSLVYVEVCKEAEKRGGERGIWCRDFEKVHFQKRTVSFIYHAVS